MEKTDDCYGAAASEVYVAQPQPVSLKQYTACEGFFFYCAPPLTVLSCQNPPDCFHSLADANNLASMGQLARFCSSNADEPKKNNSYRGRHFQIPHLKLIM
jgi:hypothetical protein